MSAHTPGPWEFLPKPYSIDIRRVGSALFVAATSSDAYRTREEATANAKLIAAAPDLAEALSDLQKAFRECIGGAAFWDFEQSNPAVRAAQRALAKAGL